MGTSLATRYFCSFSSSFNYCGGGDGGCSSTANRRRHWRRQWRGSRRIGVRGCLASRAGGCVGRRRSLSSVPRSRRSTCGRAIRRISLEAGDLE